MPSFSLGTHGTLIIIIFRYQENTLRTAVLRFLGWNVKTYPFPVPPVPVCDYMA